MFKVLIVDDEPMARDALKMATDWEEYGFIIAGECENGEETLILTAKIHPDLILTDIKMPDMDGLELTRRVLEIDRDTKFIIVSGYDEFGYAKMALKLGIRYYLLKPVFEEDISKVLLEVLDELERREELKRIDAESNEATVEMFFEELLSGRMARDEIYGGLPRSLQPDGNELWTYAALHMVRAFEFTGGTEASRSMIGYEDLKKAVQAFETDDVQLFIVFHDTRLFGLILKRRPGGLACEPWQDLVYALKKFGLEGFYLAVGNPVNDLSGLPESMNETETALEYRFFYPPGSILLYREIKDRSLNYSYEGIHYMEAFLDSLENLDRESISASIKSMFDAFHKSYIAPEVVRMYLINIICKSFAILSEIGGISGEMSLSVGMERLLESNPSLDALEKAMKKYAESFCRYAQSLKNRVALSDMKKVEDYIRSNFKRSLTVKEIARKLFIHPTYLGHQINKWFGCGFNEYLHKMRMKEAVRLMSETDMRIHEIASGLGYNTYSSFLEQFVKNFSIKPAEFRNHIRGSSGRAT